MGPQSSASRWFTRGVLKTGDLNRWRNTFQAQSPWVTSCNNTYGSYNNEQHIKLLDWFFLSSALSCCTSALSIVAGSGWTRSARAVTRATLPTTLSGNYVLGGVSAVVGLVFVAKKIIILQSCRGLAWRVPDQAGMTFFVQSSIYWPTARATASEKGLFSSSNQNAVTGKIGQQCHLFRRELDQAVRVLLHGQVIGKVLKRPGRLASDRDCLARSACESSMTPGLIPSPRSDPDSTKSPHIRPLRGLNAPEIIIDHGMLAIERSSACQRCRLAVERIQQLPELTGRKNPDCSDRTISIGNCCIRTRPENRTSQRPLGSLAGSCRSELGAIVGNQAWFRY